MPALLEEIDLYLIDLYSAQYHEQYRTGWEQTRFIAYVTAQVQSTKKLKPEDIMPFPWDKEGKEGKEGKKPDIDMKEIERIRAEMKKIEEKSAKNAKNGVLKQENSMN
jgi:hypothetical protein